MTPFDARGATIDIVDVFATTPGRGNPVAIVYGCGDRPADWKQSFAHWIGQPETVFVTPANDPVDAHAVEIFSPVCELPFAGHPAIGATRSLIGRGLGTPQDGEIRLTCKAGAVSMRLDETGEIISFVTPKAAVVEPASPRLADEVAAAVGASAPPLDVTVADTGARWIITTFAAIDDLYGLSPDMARIERLSVTEQVSGVTALAREPGGAVELRSFGPVIGVPEDAVCGGGNACAAAAISAQAGFAPESARYVARQGRALGRDGEVFVEGPLDDRRFMIGGRAHVVVSGALRAPA